MAERAEKPERKTTEHGALPGELAVIPLRNSVLFPNTIIPLTIGRERSLKALDHAMSRNQPIAVISQKDAQVEEPTPDQLFDVGTAARVVKVIDMPEGIKTVLVQGLERVRVHEIATMDPFVLARVEKIFELTPQDTETEALTRNLRDLAQRAITLSPNIPKEAGDFIADLAEPAALSDLIASNLNISVEEKMKILETFDVKARMKRITWLLGKEVEILELSRKIQSEVKGEMDKGQKEYFLRKQMEAIQKELGEISGEESEVDELRKKVEAAGMPEAVKKVADKELTRLARIPQSSAEYTVARTYVDWLLDVPWSKKTEDNLDIKRAEEILNEDHYDLEKVKKRILEYLAVRKLKADMKGPILCLVGPPGVGKTSLGKSIARALGREFIRMSLGGVRDEAEIRGHRRTYVGALPGRVLQGMKRVGTINPVFMLDEVDKLGSDFRGDPSSALLEVLDPEQNDTFQDHYLEVQYNLSHVLFVATANRMDTIPPPLLDRMEVIELPGYTQEDKLRIARGFLVKEQLDAHGLKPEQVEFTDEGLNVIIDEYTREAGVRSLKREIAGVCRGLAKEIASGEKEREVVDGALIRRILGAQRFFQDVAERTSIPGVATGLAWTPTGGDILFIEATLMKGSGKLILTGQLGDVMKESAQAALSFIRANAREYKIEPEVFEKSDIHIHIPAGAIPKDGPSAGITLLTALASLLTGKRVDARTAMTGEITLRGMVLPVGGIKEKVLAAKRAGITTIVLPEKNQKDMEDIPLEVRNSLAFRFVSQISDSFQFTLTEDDGRGKPTRKKEKGEVGPLVRN
jgi:ATP-dependent Lon protease